MVYLYQAVEVAAAAVLPLLVVKARALSLQRLVKQEVLVVLAAVAQAQVVQGDMEEVLILAAQQVLLAEQELAALLGLQQVQQVSQA